MAVSPERSRRMKYSAVIGAVAGFAVFTVFYYTSPNWAYLFFFPFGAAMGLAYAYVTPGSESE
ncbi:MAG: hypothetical protein RBQ77_04860 [Candidatus Methanomethylophilaceae archaeon]|nr:hypothetical protein [Candidatus Methanomethylophilaceae archaeon]